MTQHQDRTWYVLPQPTGMDWTTGRQIKWIVVIAFSFDGNKAIWLTENGEVVSSKDTHRAARGDC